MRKNEWKKIGRFGFQNITYEEACIIEEHENVKEISVMHPIGTYTNLTDNSAYYTERSIVEFDSNAINNLLKNNLISGKLPENDTEVVVHINSFDKIGDTLERTLEDGTKKQYTVVGTISWFYNNLIKENEAITLLDRNNLQKDDIVNITVLSKDVSHIYSDYFDIYYQLDSYQKGESNLDESVQYNKNLLELEDVLDSTSEFQKDINTTKGIFIAIIVICSSIFLYSLINISIIERKKYFGILKSVGATTKQMRRSIRAELFIILLFAIPLGLLIGIGLAVLIINIINNFLPELPTSYSSIFDIFELNDQVRFGIPLNIIAVSIFIIVLTSYIATAIPIRKISWLSTIGLIRNNRDNVKIKKKKPKKSKLNIEAKLAIKNVERYKTRYIAVILSMAISIILIIVSSYYVKNVISMEDLTDYNYAIGLQYETSKYGNLTEQIIDDIQKAKIAKNVISDMEYSGYNILVDKKNISEEEKEVGKEMYGEDYDIYPHANAIFASTEYSYNDILDVYYINIPILTLNEDAYLAYLQEIDVDKLEKDECILVDYVHEKTKYYDGIRITNYKEGDELILRSGMPGTADVERLMQDTDTLKIKKITDKIPSHLSFIENGPVIVGTIETINYLYGISNSNSFHDVEMQGINLEVTDIQAANQFVQSIKEKYQLNDYDEADLNNKDNNNSIRSGKIASQEDIDKTLLLMNIFIYTFIGIITLVGILNMYNAINTNLEIRKREAAGLITIGMEPKQINKMLWYENEFCGILALILGIAFGLFISYMIYLNNVDYLWYSFKIPWGAIIISTIGIIAVMLIGTSYLKKKILCNCIENVYKM